MAYGFAFIEFKGREVLWHVVVPISKPAIAMVALSLSLHAFSSEHGGTPWHLLMAASTVFSLPLIILFFLAVKTFIRSVAMTEMKG